jgi:hypothetical protein
VGSGASKRIFEIFDGWAGTAIKPEKTGLDWDCFNRE